MKRVHIMCIKIEIVIETYQFVKIWEKPNNVYISYQLNYIYIIHNDRRKYLMRFKQESLHIDNVKNIRIFKEKKNI